MKYFKLTGAIIFSVILTSSVPYEKSVVYYYTLTKLKSSRAPEKIRLVTTNNIATGKSVIMDGLLFTYKDRKADRVSISGNFSSWKMMTMTRGKDGVWFYFLPGEEYAGKIEYKFNIDGLWTEDPYNAFKRNDRMGSYVSLSEIDSPPDGRTVTYKVTGKNMVLFRTYRPDARLISLVGDFNGWNPEHDIMKRSGDGIWRLEKRLAPGTYRYKYIVDGAWMPDTFNPDSASDSAGDLCSIIKIK